MPFIKVASQKWRNLLLFFKSNCYLRYLSRGLNLKLWLKYGWFNLKLYSIFKIKAGAQLKPVFKEYETGLKFIKFGHWRVSFVLTNRLE